jgi:hypothetical protein
MEVAGILAAIYRDKRPDAMFVDKIGIGAGIFDRLLEQNIPVIGVNSATSAENKELYGNKRAEMWWRMADWLEDQPCRLPEDMALASDLSAPTFRFDSSGRRLVEKKDDMRKRGIRSPDCADALALTFAEYVAPVSDTSAYRSSARSRHGAGAATSAGY